MEPNAEPRSKLRTRLYWSMVALVFLAFFLGCLHGVANYWQWGHDGFNGGAFSMGARNSIRFGIVTQAPFYTGVAPPGPGDLYTDHPMGLHLHLVAFRWLFGDAEWAGRLVPALYSFLALLVLFVLVRRLSGPGTALAAACIYTLTPLNLIFANMTNHEQGSIFWCLVLLYFYFRWLDTLRRRHLLLCLFAATMAVQFDWPGYYLSAMLASHALATGLRRHPGWISWRREYTWLTVFSVVVLANFFGFFFWISIVRGNLDGMWNSFHWRSTSQSGYLDLLLSRALDLRGIALLALGGTWLLLAAYKAVRRKLELIHLVPALFLAVQLIHSGVFQQAGKLHCYWTYHLGPTFAVGGALVVMHAWRFLTETLGCRPLQRPFRIRSSIGTLALVAGAALLVYQVQFAFRQLRWGFATGSASYVDNYDDQFAEIAWARELGRLFDRSTVHYQIHQSVRRWRLEFAYYLDAPHAGQPALTVPGRLLRRGKRTVLLVDLNNLHNLRDHDDLDRLAGSRRTYIWDRRFVAIDAGDDEKKLTAHVSRHQQPSIWWRWLVNPDRPPVRWVPDPAPCAVSSLFTRGPTHSSSRPKGGRGGAGFEWTCSAGQVLDRLTGKHHEAGSSTLVCALRPECHTVLPASGPANDPDLILSPITGPWLGTLTSALSRTTGCRDGDLPVGLYGRAGALVDAVGLICARQAVQQGEEGGGWNVVLSDLYKTASIGGAGGAPFEFRCLPGRVLFGLTGRASALVDALGIVCISA